MDGSEGIKKGQEVLQQLYGQPGQVVGGKEMEEISPDFWKVTQEHLFGAIWSRPALGLRERIMITLVACILSRFNPGLERTLRWALNNGISREEILEIIMQVALFGGWPAGLNAIGVAKDILPPPSKKEDTDLESFREMERNESKLERGVRTWRRLWFGTEEVGGEALTREKTMSSVEKMFPEFWKMQMEEMFGSMYSRPGLGLRERRIITIAINMILAVDYKTQVRVKAWLARNIRTALIHGVSREEILEIILHLTYYGGWNVGENAFLVAKDVFASKDE